MKVYEITWVERRFAKVTGSNPDEAIENFYFSNKLDEKVLSADVVRVHRTKGIKSRKRSLNRKEYGI